MNDAESGDSNDTGYGCGFLIWLIVMFLAFYGAGWNIGNQVDVAAAQGNDYRTPPTAFADQIKEYQLGVTANDGAEWYGVYATARFIDVGWWTWAPFFLLGMPLIVLIPTDG